MASLLGEKVVQPAVYPDHLAYCPSMDLVALVTTDEQAQVYRLNGQRVFVVHNKQGLPKIRRTRWKPNGEVIHSLLCQSRAEPFLKASISPLHIVIILYL